MSPTSVSCVSEHLCNHYGENTALIDADTERSWTYRDLHEHVQNWCGYFKTKNLQAGQVVAWIAKNQIDFFAVLLAARQYGIILLPLNWRESVSVQVSVLQLAMPALIIYDALFRDLTKYFQRLSGTQTAEINDVLATAWPPATCDSLPAEAPWYLIFTSGTTGVPKAVIYTWSMHEANVRNVASRVSLSAEDQTISILPQYHTAGINLFALPVLMAGGTVRVYAESDPETLVQDLINTSINVVLLVPTLLQQMADSDRFAELKAHQTSLRLLASGGALLSKPLWDQWNEAGFIIQNGCGLTESGPTLFLQTLQEAQARPCAIGNCVPGTDICLMGPDEQEVWDGEPGEIWIRGDAVTPGYWRNSKANAGAFHDGWFRTGDIAKKQDGQYQLIDRMSDMYICGGENVFPTEVEDILLKFRGVEEVVVLGEPHSLWGETGVAFVVQHPGYFLNVEDLLAFCRSRLARYKVPKRIEFIDALPKTATGKIRRGIVLNWVRPDQSTQ